MGDEKMSIYSLMQNDPSEVSPYDKISCKNGKDWRYDKGYQTYEKTIVPLIIKTSKNVHSYGR